MAEYAFTLKRGGNSSAQFSISEHAGDASAVFAAGRLMKGEVVAVQVARITGNELRRLGVWALVSGTMRWKPQE
jgi:hypothetical protein